MKILVVCQDYPRPANKSVFAFVHSRSLYYLALGHSVDVLSFQCSSPYQWDGISVLPENGFSDDRLSGYDLTFIHMPNIRNGLRFLLQFRDIIKRPCMVVHGHELLDWAKYIPSRFSPSWKDLVSDLIQSFYDKIKVRIWRYVVKWRLIPELRFIFVSQWMKKHAELSLGMEFDSIGIPNAIIHNPIHPTFDQRKYDSGCEKVADFVTIRSFDHPKYGIDIVRYLAISYPEFTFHVYGEGAYFDRFPPPENMKVFRERFTQAELPDCLNKYRCALLPTRVDAQGVLMCEVASYGMPILTSNIDVCREMLAEFSNAGFLSNENPKIQPELPVLNPDPPRAKFLSQYTAVHELSFALGHRPVYVNGNSLLPV